MSDINTTKVIDTIDASSKEVKKNMVSIVNVTKTGNIEVSKGQEQGEKHLSQGMVNMATIIDKSKTGKLKSFERIEKNTGNSGLKEMDVRVDQEKNDDTKEIAKATESVNEDIKLLGGAVEQGRCQIPMYKENIPSMNYVSNVPSVNMSHIPNTNATMAIVMIIEGERPRYKCMISVNNNEPIDKEIVISKFTEGKWLKEIPCLGIKGGRKAMEIIKEFLNDQVMMFRGCRSCEILKPGWHVINNQYVYVTPCGPIGSSSCMIVSRYGQMFGNLFGKVRLGGVKEFLEMENLTPNKNVATIICLYIILSFLYTIYKNNNMPIKFILFVNGPRASKKTSLVLAMSQLDRINRSNAQYTFKATTAGLEAGYRMYKDAVMVIDDLCPTLSMAEQREMLKKLEVIVRCFGDGTGVKRNLDFLSEDVKVGQYLAEGGAVVTGEYITGVESSLARSLSLPLGGDDVDTLLLSRIQADEGCLGRFMYGFISFISNNLASYIHCISNSFECYRNSRNGLYSNSRYAEYYAHLKTASDVLLKYAIDTCQLTQDEINFYANKHENAINEVLHYNDSELRMESPIIRLCDAICSGIESGRYILVNKSEYCEVIEKAILEDVEFYYIPQPLIKKMKEEYDKENGYECHGPSCSSKYISKLLADNGVIASFQEGKELRYSKKIVASSSIRYVFVRKDKLYSYKRLI